MNAKLEVINALNGQGNWLELVHEEMGQGKEILLLLSPMDQAKGNGLARLCQAYHYHQASELPAEVLQEYALMLDVNDFAAKEHGISRETVFLLQPEGREQRPVHLR